ncbi:hypothetical protein RintRC_2101 [Richelia intracellularis]|nr:hypothetical protein RintRC_2101 [Richelia intracellularis]
MKTPKATKTMMAIYPNHLDGNLRKDLTWRNTFTTAKIKSNPYK